jgi:hypothetical protein
MRLELCFQRVQLGAAQLGLQLGRSNLQRRRLAVPLDKRSLVAIRMRHGDHAPGQEHLQVNAVHQRWHEDARE